MRRLCGPCSNDVQTMFRKMKGEGEAMTWMTPTFEEIDLSCEINSSVSAEL